MLMLVMAALAQTVPKRVIPPSVLVELQQVENDFELALAQDCDASRCFSKGCSYVDHAVADRARSTSMPGLSEKSGPGGEPAQAYLTRAQCSYAHEAALDAEDVQSLNRRLQAKVSGGWTTVSVSNSALVALPEYMRGPVEPEPEELVEEPVEELPPAPASWSEQLWDALLPHFFWMAGVLLATLAALILIWGWRRLGRLSPEDQALLAALGEPEPEPESDPEPTPAVVIEADPDAAWLQDQESAWRGRIADPSDPALQTLARELLRSPDRELLVQALLHFPQLSAALPSGGDVATDKLDLAELIRTANAAQPQDAAFFERLNRHALSATLGAQSDADTLRSFQQDFGGSGLALLIARVPPRIGGLLVALAPLDVQLETARQLEQGELAACAGQLMASNRMDRDEAQWLFELLEAVKTGGMPASPAPTRIRDQGSVFDAAGALSTLLAQLDAGVAAALFTEARARFGGVLPAWHQGILVPDMLFAISDEARADLMLAVDVDELTAWLVGIPQDTRDRLVASMPTALQATLSGPTPALHPARAQAGRRALARGFQRQLRRAGLTLEEAVSQ